MAVDHVAALDANCVTFFSDAMSYGYDPADDPSNKRRERMALLLAFLYTGQNYTSLPTAEEECLRIPDAQKRKDHAAVINVLLIDPAHDLPEEMVRSRVKELGMFHGGENDCRVVAEAEAIPVPVLLTFDKKMVSKLADQARGVRLCYPSDYFAGLGIVAGMRPRIIPKPSNPLCRQAWWQCIDLDGGP